MRRALFLAVVVCACSKKGAPAPPPPAAVVAPAPKEASSTSTLQVAAAVIEPPPEPVGPPSLQGRVVLHAGDSMVGGQWGLTRALEAKLTAEGAKLVRHTKVSETLASFDKDPTLRDLLSAHAPDIVILTLGTNDSTVPYPEVYAKHVSNIAKRIAPRECWWMGPPMTPGKPDTGIVKVIKENSAPCRFFDSSNLTFDRAKDGLHPSDKGGYEWAEKFWVAFRQPSGLRPSSAAPTSLPAP
jgi:acyl-CoA thioesterase-1